MSNKWAVGEHERYLKRYIFPYYKSMGFYFEYNPPYKITTTFLPITSKNYVDKSKNFANFDTSVIDGGKFTIGIPIVEEAIVDKLYLVDSKNTCLHTMHLPSTFIFQPGDNFIYSYNIELN